MPLSVTISQTATCLISMSLKLILRMECLRIDLPRHAVHSRCGSYGVGSESIVQYGTVVGQIELDRFCGVIVGFVVR